MLFNPATTPYADIYLKPFKAAVVSFALEDRRRRTRRHDQAAIRLSRECSDGTLDLGGVAYVDRTQLHPERRRRELAIDARTKKIPTPHPNDLIGHIAG